MCKMVECKCWRWKRVVCVTVACEGVAYVGVANVQRVLAFGSRIV